MLISSSGSFLNFIIGLLSVCLSLIENRVLKSPGLLFYVFWESLGLYGYVTITSPLTDPFNNTEIRFWHTV